MKPSAWYLIALRWGLAALALGLAAWPAAAAAPAAPPAQSTPITLTASAGFDGYFKDGRWLPVRVSVANNGPDVQGRLEVTTPASLAGGGSVAVGRTVDLPTQSRRELFLYLAPDGVVSSVLVRLVADGKDLAPPVSVLVRQLSANDLLFGVLAGSPTPYNILADVDPVNGQAYVAQVDVNALPALAPGWQALDVLVVSDVDTGALSLEQRAAVSAWVDSGGQLLVMGGPGWQKTAAGLADLLPAAPTGTRSLTDLGPLAAFAGWSEAPAGEAVAAVGTLTAAATPLVGTAADWLVAERRQGFGQVVYFAADPAFAPLRAWDGASALFRQVLAETRDQPSWAAGLTNWSSAQSAVDALPDLALPSPFLICGFLGLYLVIVGPLNYLILRWLKRRELAWVTIPATVAVFSLIAYAAGYGLAGSQPTLHQLSVVQVWPGIAQARLDQAVGLFSPRRTTYALEFAPGVLARPLPNSLSSNDLRVEQSEQTRITGVRTEIAAVQSFLTAGWVPAPSFTGDLTLDLAGGAAQVRGTVTNDSDLTLTDAVLLAPGGVLRLGDFAPGEARPVTLILSGGRASAALTPGVLPAGPAGPKPGAGAPYYAGSYDSTIDDILGTSNYYDDRRMYRRYSLLSAALSSSTGGTTGRGSGLYLAGWVAAPAAAIRVLDTPFETEAETLYLIALPAALEAGQGPLTITPALMTWSVLSSAAGGAAAPYDATYYPGDEAAFRFVPVRAVAAGRVQSLTVSVAGSSYGAASSTNTPPQVELWDFTQAAWAGVGRIVYGTQTVEDPARFVGPAGELRARVLNHSADTLNVTSLEFTLTVEP